eukprot:7265594-Ditylum_brightwellii.AAC.1
MVIGYFNILVCTTMVLTTIHLRHKGQNVTQGPESYAVAKTLLKADALTVFKQAEIIQGNQTVLHFNKYLDDVAEHVFPEKA